MLGWGSRGGGSVVSAVWELVKQLLDGGAVQGDAYWFSGDSGAAVRGDE